MRSSIIVLAVGLLAAPLSMLTTKQPAAQDSNIFDVAGLSDTVNGHPLQPAPIPAIGPQGESPADRAGGPGSTSLGAGPVDSTPFSDAPVGIQTGTNNPRAERDTAFLPGGNPPTTPNVGK